MYMNGRGPMTGGHRGPMTGGPIHHHRPMGFFPLGGLLILPALMFGGWIAVAVLGGILGLAGSIIGGVFRGLGALASGAFSGGGLVIGTVIGIALYFRLKKRNSAGNGENTCTVDGEAAESEIAEPQYRQMNY